MMPQARNDLSADYVRSILDYDPETGFFTWRYRPSHPKEWNTRYVGTRAGSASFKGVIISIDGVQYKAHRLAWLIMTGEWPEHEIDHEKGDVLDNRWRRLRRATPSQNTCNRSMQSNNTSGYKGVSWHHETNKWRASICVRRHQYHLGLFDTAEAAHEAYKAAAIRLHKGFARFN